MSKKKRKPADWEEARRRCGLNDDDIRMARELGMAAGSLIKNILDRRQMWKLPVKDWVRELYRERFGGADRVMNPTFSTDGELDVAEFDPPDDSTALPEDAGTPCDPEQLRTAGVYVARELSLLPEVVRIALFSLDREEHYRVAELAVWLTDLCRLKALQNARGEALNRLRVLRGIEVAVSHVDVHILEPGRDRYRGRLCNLGVCPDRFADACMVNGCGAQPFLRQLRDYQYDRSRLTLTYEVLFERPGCEPVWSHFYEGGADDDVPF